MGKLRSELGPFFRHFVPQWRWMALGTLMGLITVVAGVGLLSLSGWFISATAVAGLNAATANAFNFFYPSIGVRLFAFSRTAARYGERIFSHDATFRILKELRVWFYGHLEPLTPGPLARFRSGDILNRIVADIDALDNLYLRTLSPGIIALCLSGIFFMFLRLFDPMMAGTTLAFLAAAGVGVPMLAGNAGAKTGRRLAAQSATLRTRIVEGIQGMPELLVFGAHRRHLEAVKQEHRALIRSQLRMSHIRGISAGMITLLSGAAMLSVLWIGADRVGRGTLDGPELALAVLGVLAAFEAVMPLPTAFQYLGRTREAGRRLLEIVNTAPEVIFPGHSAARPDGADVTFDAVSFGYTPQGPPVLDRVRLHIPAGQRVALLGETGAGKSTLANLLVRFHDPDAGEIRLGGADIRCLSESDLRGQVVMVSQQAHMFNASLRDNLLIARSDAPEADIRSALASARLLGFAEGLPEGLDTWIGEAGKRLSGGQARRLAVARAILRDAPVWVLDEPTEGLDTITEQALMTELLEVSAGRTVLMITHRPVGLHRMDRVLVLEGGKIRERR
ncbi:thiol reductant ABC exporter subunit CydC [Desulfonema ishimotonii]|uniref:Thiol reductant ABC exporter subunit CydC n=1 Tax=Desulfonema ishimotonii TaxID=45657 RepID=A0A401FY99_9BACT|nr:thiol reductant ABC exporter subunit CydC [Desulfonema ishimotonii]GBC61930.1 thiol reductant ABC exporter subunit CydC [Desulfonema ishimotonii]